MIRPKTITEPAEYAALRVVRQELQSLGVWDWVSRLCTSRGLDPLRVLAARGKQYGEHLALSDTRTEIIAVVEATYGLGIARAARVFGVHHKAVQYHVDKYEGRLRARSGAMGQAGGSR